MSISSVEIARKHRVGQPCARGAQKQKKGVVSVNRHAEQMRQAIVRPKKDAGAVGIAVDRSIDHPERVTARSIARRFWPISYLDLTSFLI